MNGTVKFFNVAKAFGFVTPDEGAKDVFVSAAALTAAGIPVLIAGQRLSFDTTDEGKSPKAINLKLLEGVRPVPPRPVVQAHAPSRAESAAVTLYFDPSYDEYHSVLAALRSVGLEPRIVNYVAAPPTSEKLKQLSFRLLDGNPSLARRYEPLFHNLRLDDRFIGQNEFWEAIVEHPSLINGPILEAAAVTSICKSESAVRTFLNAIGYRPVARIEPLAEVAPAMEVPVHALVTEAPLEARNNDEAAPQMPEPIADVAPENDAAAVADKPKRGRKPSGNADGATKAEAGAKPKAKSRAKLTV